MSSEIINMVMMVGVENLPLVTVCICLLIKVAKG